MFPGFKSYANAELREEWLGYVTAKDDSWIMFVPAKGDPCLYLKTNTNENGEVYDRMPLQSLNNKHR